MNASSEANVRELVREYQSHLSVLTRPKEREETDDWAQVAGLLSHSAGWSHGGAEHVVALARKYGTFVLRNALALAISLEIEDGEYGL